METLEHENSTNFKDLVQLTHEYERAREKVRDEKSLNKMSVQELHELRQEYESQIKKYNMLRLGFSRENEKRVKAIELMDQELKQMQGNSSRVDQIIQTWTANTMQMQSILTMIEVCVLMSCVKQPNNIVVSKCAIVLWCPHTPQCISQCYWLLFLSYFFQHFLFLIPP